MKKPIKKNKTEKEILKEISIDGKVFICKILRKSIKNVYLRVKRNGDIVVSADKRVPMSFIESFIESRKQFIFDAFQKFETSKEADRIRYFSESDLKEYVISFSKRIYPYYESQGISFPEIKFKNMVSQWGNCKPKKNSLTFNLNLVFAPKECVEYVIYHEFTHFLRADHSAGFYLELTKVCPEWKKFRQKLKSISIGR